MASFQLSAASTRAALVRPAFAKTTPCPTCVSRRTYLSTTMSRRIQPTKQHRMDYGRRLFSQQPPKRPRPSTKIEWYPIPVAVGVGFLGLMQGYKMYTREEKPAPADDGDLGEPRPKKRPRIRPDGPWQVQVMSTLPLKALSRLWGKFNELDIPYYLRVPGFRLYSWIFGVNLNEIEEPDLHNFPNLAAFFYRTLKPGVRPLDPNQNALLSPADGRVLQFGQIEGGDIEQVKGMTYTIDALLGQHSPSPSISSSSSSSSLSSLDEKSSGADKKLKDDEALVNKDEEFARVNGISYTLPDLLSGTKKSSKIPPKDESVTPSPASVSEVRADLALGEKPWYALLSEDSRTTLYYAVIYLAPGDYHRFHSPANWVVERRRHFAGELFSVSPYLQRTLPGLFTLNERVVLLGRWRWGFFSYVPVGATNVGSIKINFDRELRTNSLTTDTAADRAAEEAAERGEPYLGYAEATYESASEVLQGHALRRGEEMGGFQLGSTIVLVFEAPVSAKDESGGHKGWSWNVELGQKVKVGQALGYVDGA
ncbi:phosphatidylserine decarboxylase-domain-containing protein [Apodospora peruviana]|uniref:Phosphatidylserine decarboxylase proenzyme 1, mitochondrial n=1 Tax=Apodospora peruviana TaxID=516989 RepID=A0AAE0II05_9PEZI|nr:phosphatidylserine decarboxylase-domain-containing protein [Apodospora peruviana]